MWLVLLAPIQGDLILHHRSPSQPTFPFSPATVVIGDEKHGIVWVATEVVLEDDGSSEVWSLVGHARDETKWFPCAELEELSPTMWRGRLVAPDGAGHVLTVRPTREADAVRSTTMEGFPRVPMPVAVIADVHESGVFVMPQLCGLSDYDGRVVGLLLHSDVGVYLRCDRAWSRMSDAAPIAEVEVFGIPAGALAVFDEAQRTGRDLQVEELLTSAPDALPAGVRRR